MFVCGGIAFVGSGTYALRGVPSEAFLLVGKAPISSASRYRINVVPNDDVPLVEACRHDFPGEVGVP
jgi:hypothetical protein